jgi:hypothetical protein
MKKLTMAVLAGFMTLAFAGAYAADDTKKSDTGATKSEKGAAKSADKSKGDAVTDDKKKKDDKTK